MNKKVILTVVVEAKNWEKDNVEVGDYIEYKEQIYKFEGYEYGLHPIAKNVVTGEQIELPSK